MTIPSLQPAGEPRRLLAIDGGGVRSGISIGILTRIEEILRQKTGKPDLVLADYFDYLAGTSVGAILAAGLSTGMSMEQIQQFTTSSVDRFFLSANVLQRVKYKYKASGVKDRLRELFGDIELGSPRLKTLLLVIARNSSTDSIWPVSNNPRALFNQPEAPDCNLRIPLWQLLRSSTAAPTFFPPEQLQLDKTDYSFVDGGVTVANNPAFQLFLHAVLPCYRLEWPTGTDRLLLVSVGTGHVPARNTAHASILGNAIGAIQSLLSATDVQQDLLCRTFGKCLVGSPIDLEVGDLRDAPTPWPKQFTYCRYNIELSAEALQPYGIVGPADRFHAIDNASIFQELLDLGRALGTTIVREEHFRGFDR